MSQKHAKEGSCNAAKSTCPTCGKEFWFYLSWPRKYCSNACKGKGLVSNIKHFKESHFTTSCEQCGKSFEVWPTQTRGRFCSRKCWGAWHATHIVGDAHPNKGRKFGRPPYLPPPVYGTCIICGDQFLTKASHLARRITCSRRCYAIILAEKVRGENNFNWQGGYEPYYGPSWIAARNTVRERDRVCQICGITPEEHGRELDVHHIKPFRTFGRDHHQEANELSNLILLCPTCHTTYEHAT